MSGFTYEVVNGQIRMSVNNLNSRDLVCFEVWRGSERILTEKHEAVSRASTATNILDPGEYQVHVLNGRGIQLGNVMVSVNS